MTPRAAPLVVELGLHALALVPAPEPGSLHDPRYAAWCRAHLPDGAWRPVADDAPALAALAARAGAAWWALQHLPFAHRELDGLVAAARHPADALDPRAAARPEAVAALRALARSHEALVEVARADVALVARPYARAFEARVAPEVARALGEAAPAFEAACALAPALAGCEVLLSFALGARGRAFGDTLVLGAPAGWNGLPPAHPAVLALHERAVALAAREATGDATARWAWSEGVALAAVAELVRGSGLEGAWARWRKGVDARGVGGVAAGDGRAARVLAALRGG